VCLRFSNSTIAVALGGAAVISTVISITALEVLMALSLVAFVAMRRRWRVPPIWLPLALFLVGTLVSLAASGHVEQGWPQVKKFFVYLMLFLAATAFENLRQVRLTVLTWSAAIAVAAARGVWQFAQKHEAAAQLHQPFYTYYIDSRITGFSSHWMTFGGEMMIGILLIAALVFFGAPHRWSVWLTAAAGLAAAAFALAWTRSMWLGALCGGAYLIWFWRRWVLLALPVAAGVILWANPLDLGQRAISAFSPHGSTDSNAHRAELRGIGERMIAAHPWLGVGPEQVSRQAPKYLPPGMTGLTPGQYYGHLENDYLQYAAERGIPTMLALLWMIGWALFDFCRVLRRLPDGAEERWMLHAAVAVTIGMLVSGLYSWNLNNTNILAMFLAVLGCGYVAVWVAER
jgi:putative inorganic carbon (hco3(-)) transporter